MTTIGFAIVYCLAMLVAVAVRRFRYNLFSLAAGAATGALVWNLFDASWLAAGIWVLNIGLVAFNWVRWRALDARRDAIKSGRWS